MPDAPRVKVRRTPGRRASDRRPKLETILGVAVLLAWTWSMYEVGLVFIH